MRLAARFLFLAWFLSLHLYAFHHYRKDPALTKVLNRCQHLIYR